MRHFLLALCLLAVALVSGPARAADLPVVEDPVVIEEVREWRFALATYLWAAGLSGESAVGGLPPADIDLAFRDILASLDFAAFVTGEARFRRLVGFADIQYVKTTTEENTPLGVLAQRFKLRSETFSAIVSGGYQVIDTERALLDAVAGARVYSVSNRLSVRGGLLGEQGREQTETWVDPIIGLKGRYQFDPRFHLLTWGFVGGFGAASDINWDVLGAIGWSPTPNTSLLVGYRASGVDFSRGDFIYDVVQQGPVIGGVIRF